MYGNVNVYFLLPTNYEQPTWNEEWLLTTYGCGYQLTYGFMQEKKDWPLMMANLPGVLFGTIAAITAL